MGTIVSELAANMCHFNCNIHYFIGLLFCNICLILHHLIFIYILNPPLVHVNDNICMFCMLLCFVDQLHRLGPPIQIYPDPKKVG